MTFDAQERQVLEVLTQLVHQGGVFSYKHKCSSCRFRPDPKCVFCKGTGYTMEYYKLDIKTLNKNQYKQEKNKHV